MSVYRSFLFTPGNHSRRVEKSLSLAADAVILDLEDAVANDEKVATRALVVEALRSPRRCKAYVRVNALSTDWAYGDIEAVVAPGLDGIVLPKVESASDLHTAEWMIASLERARGLTPGAIDLMPIIETARGYVALESIVRSGTRVRRVAFGAGDFTLDAGIRWTSAETELLPYRSGVVVHSRAAGLEPPIDTVWVELRNTAGFEHCVQHVKDLGFQGKMCIHPDQIARVNQTFRQCCRAGAGASSGGRLCAGRARGAGGHPGGRSDGGLPHRACRPACVGPRGGDRQVSADLSG